MKQSKGSKQLKSVSLSTLDGVRDVALGHKATADRPARNYAKANDRPSPPDAYHDVAARNKRWGLA